MFYLCLNTYTVCLKQMISNINITIRSTCYISKHSVGFFTVFVMVIWASSSDITSNMYVDESRGKQVPDCVIVN